MSVSPKFQLNISYGGRVIELFLLVSAKTAHRARVESRVGRADNYNAYHKLAVAVAEVWGSAIWVQKLVKNCGPKMCTTFWSKRLPKHLVQNDGWEFSLQFLSKHGIKMLVHKVILNLIKNFGPKLVKNFLTKIGQNLFIIIFVQKLVQNIGWYWSKNFFLKMVQNVCSKIGHKVGLKLWFWNWYYILVMNLVQNWSKILVQIFGWNFGPKDMVQNVWVHSSLAIIHLRY